MDTLTVSLLLGLLAGAPTVTSHYSNVTIEVGVDRVEDDKLVLDIEDYPSVVLPRTVCGECKEGVQADLHVYLVTTNDVDGVLVIDVVVNAKRTDQARKAVKRLQQELLER